MVVNFGYLLGKGYVVFNGGFVICLAAVFADLRKVGLDSLMSKGLK
ncbi:hypothetical protein Anacy_5966 (plasmid) [Anabaena cylindrica PCC 7122]|uniref:Uncharacterized protein n=1 Tax=Anabaena cylindrica (strain ATCC 27899 / PCC 7122) TaxID=272123 RepID=K9ZR60_ANACC|nr:hypothetical protein Anacy_5966 [Anabaena cylindrica PCC 7122]BAY06774.1 hypothetical protein NIES19_60570 [Anabaena cylindrica PCC 7122]